MPTAQPPRAEVADTLASTGVATVTLRAAVILGSGSASFEMLRYLTERLPVMVTPRWVRNRIQPIAIGDVLHYLVGWASVNMMNQNGTTGGGSATPVVVTSTNDFNTQAAGTTANERHTDESRGTDDRGGEPPAAVP